MKKLPSVRVILMTIIAIILVNIIFSFDYNEKQSESAYNTVNTIAYADFVELADNKSLNENLDEVIAVSRTTSEMLDEEEIKDLKEKYPEFVYGNMTMDDLAEKLDRNLKSSLSGYGHVIASYAIEYDVDPYLATAIILHETGCSSKCSALVRKCNNVGGMKGSPSCGNGGYARFSSLDEGIRRFMKNLSNNYIKKGLTTPEAINRKYAESDTWSQRIKYYMNKVKNS